MSILSRTSTLRSGTDTGLFIPTRPPYQAVSSSTIAQWVKKVLQASGVPSFFTAHSTRGASTTAAAISGVTMAVVLAAAHWSNQHTFIEHYYRPESQLCILRGGSVVWRSGSTQTVFWSTFATCSLY